MNKPEPKNPHTSSGHTAGRDTSDDLESIVNMVIGLGMGLYMACKFIFGKK